MRRQFPPKKLPELPQNLTSCDPAMPVWAPPPGRDVVILNEGPYSRPIAPRPIIIETYEPPRCTAAEHLAPSLSLDWVKPLSLGVPRIAQRPLPCPSSVRLRDYFTLQVHGPQPGTGRFFSPAPCWSPGFGPPCRPLPFEPIAPPLDLSRVEHLTAGFVSQSWAHAPLKPAEPSLLRIQFDVKRGNAETGIFQAGAIRRSRTGLREIDASTILATGLRSAWSRNFAIEHHPPCAKSARVPLAGPALRNSWAVNIRNLVPIDERGPIVAPEMVSVNGAQSGARKRCRLSWAEIEFSVLKPKIHSGSPPNCAVPYLFGFRPVITPALHRGVLPEPKVALERGLPIWSNTANSYKRTASSAPCPSSGTRIIVEALTGTPMPGVHFSPSKKSDSGLRRGRRLNESGRS